MQQPLLNIFNEEISSIEVNADIFQKEVRADILARVIHWQLAKRRAGTHSTKTISMVQGTTKKPWKQKGTGRARQGSLRSAQFRKGAIAFGPHPRDYSYSLPKKVRKLGLKIALSSKILEKKLFFVDDLKLEKDSYKKFRSLIKTDEKILFIDSKFDDQSFLRAISNHYNANYLPVIGMNVYDIINSGKIYISKNAIKDVETRLL